MEEKFIQVGTVTGNVVIAISQISSIRPHMGGAIIVLKEIKDGQNVEITTGMQYGNVLNMINWQSQS